MEFLLGCNYWASNAGTEMWRDFDVCAIDRDLSILAKNGVKHLRVFPNWRDFQPVTPIYENRGNLVGYEGNRNYYYIDEEMLSHFSKFLDLCDRYGLKVIVGLITGFMSGRMFVPAALLGKNIITDPMSQYLQQLFIKGFVNSFKDRDTIIAWDLGNECNEMENVNNHHEADSWIALVSNAIKAADPTRPVVSGMHYLNEENLWKFSTQGEFTDILTTHPYPYWCEFTRIDKTMSPRTLLFSTIYTKYYAEVSGKPCLSEEMGTMGPMICSDENAGKYMRLNLYSLWANNALGALWWCGCDQNKLNTHPYTALMVERELGLIRNDGTPKPTLLEIKSFREFLNSLDFKLSPSTTDGVCILSKKQNHWEICYMSYLMAAKSNLNLTYTYCDSELPYSDLYLLPSISGTNVIHKETYEELKARVYEGADLYISLNDGILTELEEFVGVRVIDSFEHNESLSVEIKGATIPFKRERTVILEATSARVLYRDSNGNPFATVNNYGKGRVFFVNAPIEKMLTDTPNAYDTNNYMVYKELLCDHINKAVEIENDYVIHTLHEENDGYVVVALNLSGDTVDPQITISNDYKIDAVYRGEINSINGYDACVFRIIKR
ncbi:MAG: cellulase family glycosylhydrolase [Clostridia bacterium]|nr:cellulase family glycosylhydrolase [Clostridia bacterium]